MPYPIAEVHRFVPRLRQGCLLAGMLALVAPATAQQHPSQKWEFAVETGYLTKIRNNSPLDYTIVPTQLVWRSPALFNIWQGADGARLTVRNRLAVVAETYLKGAEDYYLAFAGSPTFELWSADQRSAIFYEIGGGAGFTNSKGVAGGQGQDFTFNWFSQLGLRRQINEQMGITGGLYFTHHSNLGMTKPNPGIDVLGLNIGVAWSMD